MIRKNLLYGVGIGIFSAYVLLACNIYSFKKAKIYQPIGLYLQSKGVNADAHIIDVNETMELDFYDSKGIDNEGRKAKLIDLVKNKKGTILFFWSKICPFCESHMKQIDEFSKKYKNINCVMVALNDQKSSREVLRKIYSERCPNLAKNGMYMDKVNALFFNMLDGEKPVLPIIVFINPKGQIISKVIPGISYYSASINWEKYGDEIASCKFEGVAQ